MPLKYEHLKETWIKEYESGISFSEIGRTYGASKATVAHTIKQDITKRPKSKFTEHEETIVNLYVNHMYSKTAIAQKYQTSTTTIMRILERHGIPSEKNEKLRKYEHLVPLFVDLYQEGKSLKAIEKITGVSHETVSKYLKDTDMTLRTYSESARKHPLNETYFDQIDTDEKAYHLGVVFGKGNLYTFVGTSFLQLSISAEKGHLLESLFTCLKTDKFISPYVGQDGVARYRLNSTHLYNTLDTYGLKENCIKNIEETFMPSFIVGYFSVKGSVYQKKNNLYVSGSEAIIQTIADRFKTIIPAEDMYIEQVKKEHSVQMHIRMNQSVQAIMNWLSNHTTYRGNLSEISKP